MREPPHVEAIDSVCNVAGVPTASADRDPRQTNAVIFRTQVMEKMKESCSASPSSCCWPMNSRRVRIIISSTPCFDM
jgi:hypothetical protein